MGVDQPRDQGVLGELDPLVVAKRRRRRRGRKDLLDAAAADGDGVVLQDRARRLDRQDPAGAKDEAACCYLGVPWTSTTTRRLGARQEIRPLRSFWSGQDCTGRVLPKPRVSTLEASTPFDTR